MAAYKNLTTNIFACLFQYMAYNPMSIIELKTILPVVGVCQAWRNAALPEVYKTVYVDSATSHYFGPGTYGQEYTIYDKSNLGIVVENGHTGLVKKWVLRLSSFKFLRSIDFAKDIFDNKSNDWSSTTTFDLTIDDRYYNPIRYQPVLDLMRLLKTNLPNIDSVKMFHMDNNLITATEFKDIINSFSDKLFSLNIGVNFFHKNILPLGNITTLALIPYKYTKGLLSSLNLQKLKSLTLYKIPADFKWDIFSNDKSKNSTIIFGKLCNLRLMYLSATKYEFETLGGNSTNTTNVVLEYPSLQTLSISKNHSFDDSYVTHKFSKHIQKVLLSGGIEMAQWFIDQKFTRCNNLVFDCQTRDCFFIQDYNTPLYSETLNTIFGSSNTISKVTALTNIPRYSMKQDNLHWQGLKFLEVCNEISYDKLGSFIKKLPELLVFTAKHITFQYRPRFNSMNRTIRLQQHLKPFDSKLHTLKIKNACNEVSLDYNVWCLDRLLLRLLNLKVFITDRTTIKAMDGYNDLFKKTYPHAENVQFLDGMTTLEFYKADKKNDEY